jgi:hypothetical protein
MSAIQIRTGASTCRQNAEPINPNKTGLILLFPNIRAKCIPTSSINASED